MSAKPYVLGILGVAVGLAGISELADATLTEHQRLPAGSRTVVTVHGSTVDEGEYSLHAGVDSLVRICQLEVGRNIGVDPIRPLEGDRFQFEFQPGLDDADQDQFRGCIGDIVVDHLQASVETMTYVGPQ